MFVHSSSFEFIRRILFFKKYFSVQTSNISLCLGKAKAKRLLTGKDSYQPSSLAYPASTSLGLKWHTKNLKLTPCQETIMWGAAHLFTLFYIQCVLERLSILRQQEYLKCPSFLSPNMLIFFIRDNRY